MEAATARLARLAAATDDAGAALVPSADPRRWWGMAELSETSRPVVAAELRSPAVGKPTRRRAGLSAAVVPGPAGAGGVGPQRRRPPSARWFTCWPSTERRASDVPSLRHRLSDQLDTVWDQLSFDAKWLSAVERVEAESAVERFLAWQEARTQQELLGTEVGFRCDIDLGVERVHLTGTADRVERDPDGRIRIVDFKTSKTEPRAADVAVQDQLGVYQLAVQAGAFAEVAGPGRPARRRRTGLSALARRRRHAAEGLRSGLPRRRPVPARRRRGDPAEPGRRVGTGGAELAGQPTWVHRRLLAAAQLIRAERFDARLGPACRYCPFRGSCPAQSAGRQVVA